MSIDLDLVWKQFDNIKLEEYNEKEKSKPPQKCLCENQSIIEYDNTLLCENCGLIMENTNISDEAEWRSFADDNGFKDDGNRVGMPVDSLTPVSGMSTMISGNNTKLQNLNMWISVPYDEKVIFSLRTKLSNIVTLNNLPVFLISTTLHLYKSLCNIKDHNKNHFFYRGKNKDGIISVCFYYATRHNDISLSSSYISSIFGINKKTFSKCCRMYNELIKNDCDNTVIDQYDLLDRYGNILNLSFHIKKLSKKIIRACISLNMFNNTSPQTLISGVIYFISQEMELNIDKRSLKKVCDISEMTMIKTTKVLIKNKIKIFNFIKHDIKE